MQKLFITLLDQKIIFNYQLNNYIHFANYKNFRIPLDSIFNFVRYKSFVQQN